MKALTYIAAILIAVGCGQIEHTGEVIVRHEIDVSSIERIADDLCKYEWDVQACKQEVFEKLLDVFSGGSQQ